MTHMTLLFEILQSVGVHYGERFNSMQLQSIFGVKGNYSYTHSIFGNTSFFFAGRQIQGNTRTRVSKTGEITITTVLRAGSVYDKGLLPEVTEIGDVAVIIERRANDVFIYRGVADLNEIKINKEEKEDGGNWLLSCTIYGKLRDEENAYSLGTVESEELETVVYIPTKEGKKRAVYTTKYERNPANRAAAIAAHGTVCMACGFDFGKVYGKYGEGYIEVHHAKPLFENETEVTPDPENDLICLCANCHRMVHHYKNKVLSLDELRSIIAEAKL